MPGTMIKGLLPSEAVFVRLWWWAMGAAIACWIFAILQAGLRSRPVREWITRAKITMRVDRFMLTRYLPALTRQAVPQFFAMRKTSRFPFVMDSLAFPVILWITLRNRRRAILDEVFNGKQMED